VVSLPRWLAPSRLDQSTAGCVETKPRFFLRFIDSIDRFVVVDDVRVSIAEPLRAGQQTNEISCLDGFQSSPHGEI